MFVTLNYHIINRAIRDKIAISEEAFEAQMDYLRARDYSALSLGQAIDILDGKREAPLRSVLLTFDDGYRDNVQVALPLMQKYGMRATLFVISAYVGKTNRWNPKACYDAQHMTWHEMRFWLESGCDIGGHSHRHLCMTRLSAEEVLQTVRLNKHLLQRRLGITPRAFAYPYGGFNPAVQDVMRQHYELAFAVEDGSWDAPRERYAINRMVVYPKWNLADFAKQLDQHVSLASSRP